jgi:hypothetical protein
MTLHPGEQLDRFVALQSRDRQGVGPPRAAQGDKAVAQVPDSGRDHSKDGFTTGCQLKSAFQGTR